jgi:hypothetical protein
MGTLLGGVVSMVDPQISTVEPMQGHPACGVDRSLAGDAEPIVDEETFACAPRGNGRDGTVRHDREVRDDDPALIRGCGAFRSTPAGPDRAATALPVVGASVATEVPRILGRPARTYRDWTADHAAAFAAPPR